MTDTQRIYRRFRLMGLNRRDAEERTQQALEYTDAQIIPIEELIEHDKECVELNFEGPDHAA